jgi:hypothetical protein
MKRSVTLLTMAGLGAGLIYFLDPKRGPHRREVVKDKVSGAIHNAKAKISRKSGDVSKNYMSAGNRQF